MYIRKVRFPIKLKVILMLVFILGVSISFYVWFAIDIFKKDKSAYIYENGLVYTENLSNQASLYLRDVGNRLQLLVTVYGHTQDRLTVQSLIEKSSDFIDFTVYQNDEQTFKICNDDNPESEDICSKGLRKYLLQIRENKDQVYLKSLTTLGVIPHFLFSINLKENIFILRVGMGELNRILDQNNSYLAYMYDEQGSIFYHKNLKNVISENMFPQGKLISSLITSSQGRGTSEGVDATGETILISYSRIRGFGKYIISEISQRTAFQAASYLINKSFWFALLILSLALIIGIFFSRRITGHINKLFFATQKISGGDFEYHVNISSRDEVGALADSFNYMSDEIVRYMGEMKEKARLENEMQVASLVQTAFFPQSEIQTDNISISAYYTPATECGGDWWGQINQHDKTILILADATGHGVPAALLTATINSSASMIEHFAKKDPSLLDSPESILGLMNHAVCSVGSNIMLTCFVGIVDFKNKVMIYSNASHNPPLILKAVNLNGEVTKNNFQPLLGALGPRLGHNSDPCFEREVLEINNDDLLILYTDGLVECENGEGKQWGKRRFLTTLANNYQESPTKIRDNIIIDLDKFREKVPNEDDITLIVSRIHI